MPPLPPLPRHRPIITTTIPSNLAPGVHNRLDLRSDTLTRPTDTMRNKMSVAVVGDDVFGDDPTVMELERFACQLSGKPAAAYVASGTMGNLTSIMAHTERRASELICGDRCHIFLHEQGGAATLAGVHTRSIPTQKDGTLPIPHVLRSIRPGTGSDVDNAHYPRTALVCIENTHNDCGGVVLPLEYQTQLAEALRAVSPNIKLHLDGARAGNAAVHLGKTLRDVCAAPDSVSLCLSKGLGAPVGSLVVGSEDFIWRVRRARKALGGGWRQAGMMAAAGIVALSEMETTLQRDHVLARQFAEAIAGISGVELAVPVTSMTNLVFFKVPQGDQVVERVAKSKGMLMGYGYGLDNNLIRAAIHRDVHGEELLDHGVNALRDAIIMSASR